MNPFKEIDDFLGLIIEDEFVRGLLQIPIWMTILFLVWVFSYFLIPWTLIGVVFLGVIPGLASKAVDLVYRESESNSTLIWLGVVACGVFLAFYGISPKIYNGILFDFLMSESGIEIYWKGLNKWWEFHNFINPFSDYDRPSDFYSYHFKTARIVFWVGGLVLTSIFTFFRIEIRKEKAQKEYEESVAKWEEEIKLKELAKQREIEKEERRVEQEKEMKALAKKAEIKKERQGASTSANPWDSGFF